MKKKKNPIGRSLKEIITDVNELPLLNKNINNKMQPTVNTEEKEFFAVEYKKPDEEKIIDDLTIEDNADESLYPFNLKTIGSILKNERDKKGLTIRDVSEMMNVRRPIIEALEDARWDRLPHEIYIKGYIKEYAGILKAQDIILPYLKKETQKTESNTLKNIDNSKKSIRFTKRRKDLLSKTAILYSLIVFFIIGGFFLFTNSQQNADKLKLEKAVQLSNSNMENTEKQPTPVLTNNKKLLISCHERTWVSIIMDGNEKKEVMLNPGEVIILNAKERFDILVGNAGGIKFILNGKDVDFSGMSGQVKRITL